ILQVRPAHRMSRNVSYKRPIETRKHALES
ncbi:hypothetical protein A2U01_0069373, partial [Trifolium medium]|nr:hypothetical protein [Trifolium medium]